ncbi:MAG: sarcosine oxidase subunit gamma [Rhizobiaceae bacterium]
MVDYQWTARGPLAETGRSGRTEDLRFAEIGEFRLVLIIARRGRWSDASKAAAACYGVLPPENPGVARSARAALIWSGPGQFLALSMGSDARSLEDQKSFFEGSASLSDQSYARCLMRLSGRRVLDVMAKLSSLDFDGDVFPVDRGVATSIDHLTVNLWRNADDPDGSRSYDILVVSSYAEHLRRRIDEASTAFRPAA